MKGKFSFALAALVFSLPAAAQTTVSWVDWNSASAGQVGGVMDVGGTPVNVTFSGAYSGVQLSGGANYWTQGTPAPYTGGDVVNAPPTTDIIQLGEGGLKTITFSEAVQDPYLAFVSWNGNSGTFNQAFNIVSQGCGYWGCGTIQQTTPFSFSTISGEPHGIIRFSGTFTSVSFTDLNEYWHGITVGVAGLAPVSNVPEPSTWATMLLGFGAVGFAMRRRRKPVAALQVS